MSSSSPSSMRPVLEEKYRDKEYNFCPLCAKRLLLKEMADGGALVKRLCCPSATCGFIHYNNPTPVVGAIVEHEGMIVLIRNKGWPANFFGIVTGFLEAREDPAVGVLREVKEEIGLDGQIVRLLGVYPFERLNQIIIVYHIKATGAINPNWEELDGVKSLTREEIVPWPGGTGQAMKEFLASTAASKL